MQTHESVKARTQLKKSTRARTAHTDFVRKSKQSALNKRRRLPSQDMDDMNDIEFQKLIQALTSSPDHVLSTLEQLKAGLSVSNAERLDKVAESGVIPILLDLLERPSSTTMELTQILWSLTFITSGLYEHTKCVLPAVPTLLSFLQNPDLAEHAAFTLGNIAADCEEFRLHLIRHGAIAPLVEHLKHPQAPMLKVSLWALSNIARGVQTPGKAFFDHDIGPVSLELLRANETPDVLQELLWLLSFLTAKEDKYLRWFLENDIWSGLLHHFEDKDPNVLTPLLRVCGNICSVGPDSASWQLPYIQTLASEPRTMYMLKRLLFLDHIDPHVVAECAWVISNLAARDASIVNMLLDYEILPPLAHCFRDGGYDIRKEASFALCNIAVTSNHLSKVVELDVLDGFIQLLTVADQQVIGNALQFIEHILRHLPRGVYLVESQGGIDALEAVQDGASDFLSTKAEQLMNEFYGETYDTPFSPQNAPEAANGFSEPPRGGLGRGAHMTRPAWATQQ